MKDTFHLWLRRFDEERIVFDSGWWGGWLLAAAAVLAWVACAAFVEDWTRELGTILRAAFAALIAGGVLFGFWRDRLVIDRVGDRWVRGRGFWPFARRRTGSLDDLDAIVLTRSRTLSYGQRTRRSTFWRVMLELFPAPGNLIVYGGEDEAKARAELERYATALDRPAIDRSSGVAERVDLSSSGHERRQQPPASLRPVTAEPPPGSGIRLRETPGGSILWLPRLGISPAMAVAILVLGALGAAIAWAALDPAFGSSLPTWMSVPAGDGRGDAVPGALFYLAAALWGLAWCTTRQRVELRPETLTITVTRAGIPFGGREIPFAEIETIGADLSTASAHGLAAYLARRGWTPRQVVIHTRHAIHRLGDKPGGVVDDDGIDWLRNYLTQAVERG